MEDLNYQGKRVLIRVDFNVPLDENLLVTDNTRILKAIPTIKFVLDAGGSVILMSHLGRPKGVAQDKYSLKHIVPTISELLHQEVYFAADCIGADTKRQAEKLVPGDILLLENLRFHIEETVGVESFSKELASLADIYINDAFGTAHRAHSSTTVIARYFNNNKAFGKLLQNEIEHIDLFLQKGEKPLTAIMGGAKVSSKIGIMENLLPKIDHLVIGGGMTYSFIKAQGGSVGNSLVEDEKLELALEILSAAEKNNVVIHLPQDSVIADQFSNEASTKIVDSGNIPAGWIGVDIGPKAIEHFRSVILESKTILWNGPAGVFEMSNFAHGTKCIAESLVDATKRGSYTLIGGGDSVSAINKFNLSDKISYISTGGGALMEYLEGIPLPGIKAITD